MSLKHYTVCTTGTCVSESITPLPPDHLGIPEQDWNPMIDCDIKLANVVSGDSHKNYCFTTRLSR